MKFAFIVNNYPPKMGGVENHVKSLASELVNQGHRAVVVTLGKDVGIRVDAGVEVITLKEHLRFADTLGFPRLGTRKNLTNLFKNDISPDLVSTHTRFFPMSFVGIQAAHKAGIATVHTEHGGGHVASNSFIIKWASRFVDYTFGRAVLKRADCVLGVSEEVVQFTKKLANVNTSLFYNAIQPPEISTKKPKRTKRLVFVGRMIPGKGWEVFLDCLKQLHDSGDEFDAFLAGDGPDLHQVRSRIIELGLENKVSVLGRVSPQQVREILRRATLVNPTTLSEGFQTTLLETISEGGRVLTYPVPGANLLKIQGAPIQITDSRSPEQLCKMMDDALNEDWQPAPLNMIEKWYWPARADEFVSIADKLSTSSKHCPNKQRQNDTREH